MTMKMKSWLYEKLGMLMTAAMIKDKEKIEKSKPKMVQLLCGEDKVQIWLDKQIAIIFYNWIGTS